MRSSSSDLRPIAHEICSGSRVRAPTSARSASARCVLLIVTPMHHASCLSFKKRRARGTTDDVLHWDCDGAGTGTGTAAGEVDR